LSTVSYDLPSPRSDWQQYLDPCLSSQSKGRIAPPDATRFISTTFQPHGKCSGHASNVLSCKNALDSHYNNIPLISPNGHCVAKKLQVARLQQVSHQTTLQDQPEPNESLPPNRPDLGHVKRYFVFEGDHLPGSIISIQSCG
jgi:hypothetical protein